MIALEDKKGLTVFYAKPVHISDLRNLKPTFVGVKKKVTFIIKTF